MNNKFEELTKSLAQSVTRRAALKKLGVGLAGMALVVLLALPAAEANPVLILRDPATELPVRPLPPLGFLDALPAAGELKTKSDRAFLKVVGYGIDPGDANSGHLPFPPDGLRRSAQPEFQNLHDHWLYTDQNDSHDNGGSCNCDSGGPLFYVDPVTGQETLVAVVSRGSLSSAHDYRVDTAEALTFINDVIARVNAGEL